MALNCNVSINCIIKSGVIIKSILKNENSMAVSKFSSICIVWLVHILNIRKIEVMTQRIAFDPEAYSVF